jgi:hypothetical protein
MITKQILRPKESLEMSDITIGYMLQDGRLVVVDEEQVVVA